MTDFVDQLKHAVDHVPFPTITGKICSVSDSVYDAILPNAVVGALVRIGDTGLAQVARVEKYQCRLVPVKVTESIGAGTKVTMLERVQTIPVGMHLMGRVVSPLGEFMDVVNAVDVEGPLKPALHWPIQRNAPRPLERPAVCRMLHTGIKAIDGLLSLGDGARVGLFAGPGQGKSTLLGMLANGCNSDVCVICLAGERGREAGEFVHQTLGKTGLKKSVVVLATSDAAAAERVLAIYTATAIAEWFRDQGKKVLLLVDSLTRVVRARRDVDLALGVPVGPDGLAATSLSFLPGLLERAAPNGSGSISAVYTVLSQTQGDDLISSEITSLLDGHIILSKKRADAGKWPAIDVVKSVSRVMKSVTSASHMQHAARVRSVLSAYEENEDLLMMGAYSKGSCPLTDAYLRCRREMEQFLTQGDEVIAPDDTLTQLLDLNRMLGPAK